MSSRFELTHPRCSHCGAWAKRWGDNVQCNNPWCARVSTYTAPTEPLIPAIGYRLPKPRKHQPAVRNYPPMQDELDLEGEPECDS